MQIESFPILYFSVPTVSDIPQTPYQGVLIVGIVILIGFLVGLIIWKVRQKTKTEQNE